MSSSLAELHLVDPATPPAAPPLLELLADIPDHRHRRGVRHRLHALLAASLAAVAAGAKSCAVITEWIGDPANAAVADLGVDLARRPSEATLRRAVTSVDADLVSRPGPGNVDVGIHSCGCRSSDHRRGRKNYPWCPQPH
ncbi:transposase family protein [Corynebacterium glyciniphilum]|uniref:transposase family protein n=1 Tax=Corynebacterium glyciniphilum TaxID=1404244 RepID=UPI003FD66D39